MRHSIAFQDARAVIAGVFLMATLSAISTPAEAETCTTDFPARWLVQDQVSYSVASMPSNTLVNDDAVYIAIQESFNRWGTELDISFYRTPEGGDITLGFYNDDTTPFEQLFDGNVWENFDQTNVAGIAELGGVNVGFDDSETWKTEQLSSDFETALTDAAAALSQAANLDRIATHEIGHLIGLCHSAAENDVMNRAPDVITPSNRDIKRAQALRNFARKGQGGYGWFSEVRFLKGALGLAVSHRDPDLIYVGNGSGSVHSLSVYGDDLKMVKQDAFRGGARALATSPNTPDVLYVGNGTGSVHTLDLVTGEIGTVVANKFSGGAQALAMSETDDRTLFVGNGAGSVHTLNLTNRQIGTIVTNKFRGGALALAVSDDPHVLYVGNGNGSIHTLDTRNGAIGNLEIDAFHDGVSALLPSPKFDGRLIIGDGAGALHWLKR